jgi:Tfp pilus assembly protein PilF
VERANSPRLAKQLADSLNNLAMLEKASGKLDAATRHEQEALKLTETGSEHCGTNSVLMCNNLGAIELVQNHFVEARALFSAAAAALERQHANDEPMYAAVLSNRGSLESKLGHHKKSEHLFSRALEMDLEHFDAMQLRVATDRNNLGTELFYLKKYNEALKQLAPAAVAYEKTLGPSHVEVAKTWKNLGIVYQAARQLDLAQNTLQKAIRIAESAEGPEGAQLPPILLAYARVLRQVHRFSEAEQAEVRAVGIQVRIAVQENRKS